MASRAAQRAARQCAPLATRPTLNVGLQQGRVLSVQVGRVAVSKHARMTLLTVSRSWRPLQIACFSSQAEAKIGPMNDDIQARSVNVVGEDGVMRRGVPIGQAMEEANSNGLDLVQVAVINGQVVCRMFNAQKRLFALKKSLKQSKPKQDKEVTFGVKTEAHDLKTKATQLRSFLTKGHKVKVTVRFGKEFHLLDRALGQLQAIEEQLDAEVGGPDHKPMNQFGGVYVHFVPRSSK